VTSTGVALDQRSSLEPVAGDRPAAGTDALPVFAADAGSQDHLGRAGAAGLLAEVSVHRRVETPLTIAVFGPVGSGKSLFLREITEAVAGLSAAAARETTPSPFLSRVVVARVDAAAGGDPTAMLVGRVLDALGQDHAAFAEDAVYAGSDPREAARLAGERLNGLRRTLDGERQTLDGLDARRARLAETVLFDSAGSRVDAFARANRGRIEARLRAFGLPASDPLHSFKALVREASEASGPQSRLALVLRSLWGFKGQGTLLALTVVLLIVGWVASAGADDPGAVTAWLTGFGDHLAIFTDWVRAHLGLLGPIGRIAWALAALALLTDVVRATRFLAPVFKGANLLRNDLEGRRRDLDGLLSHQTRRVDQLAAEAEAAGRNAEAAERRIDNHRQVGISDHGAALASDLFGLKPGPQAAAEAFFAKLSGTMAGGIAGSAPATAAPDRILVAIDGLDRLPGPAAVTFLDSAHRLLGRPGFAAIVAVERHHIVAALGETDPALAAARLDRLVQLSYDLGTVAADPSQLATVLLDARIVAPPAASADATRSALDRALQPFETDLVRVLAPFAGATPRGVKRFVNSYRIARADPRLGQATPATLGSLAWALALDGTSAGSELDALESDVSKGNVTMDQGSDLGRSFAAALSAVGQEVGIEDARRGLAVARSYSRRG
jgi:hypothetical protein